MSGYDIYILVLCSIVFLLMVFTFSYMITLLARGQIKLIRCGHADDSIIKEKQRGKTSLAGRIIDKMLSVIIVAILAALLIASLFVNIANRISFGDLPVFKVVKSSSMSFKRDTNKYLFENNIDDQIEMFDLVCVYPIPAEEELELYDIVLYEVDGTQVIHRIVGIEEPNEKHPDCRHFALQGDAVKYPDIYPVRYSQMRSIYRGERIPNIGSFIVFMQTPAGWLCILLVIAYLIVEPIVVRIYKKAEDERYASICGQIGDDEEQNHGGE